MRYFPLFFDTASLRLLVVGGGEVAARKLALWSRTDAKITAVSPHWVEEITSLNNDRLHLISKPFEPPHLEGHDGVVIATDDAELNRQIAREAKALGLWVNVVDQPELCTVITPAIVDRSPMVIAIGSEGQAPVLVRTLRALLETQLPQSLGKLASLIGRYRHVIQQQQPNPRHFWERFIDRNGLGFTEQSERMLQQPDSLSDPEGRLWLMHHDHTPSMLPIGIMPALQRLDRAYSTNHMAQDLAELIRRDASRSTTIDIDRIVAQYQAGEQLLLVCDANDYHGYQARLSERGVDVSDPFRP